MFSQTRRGKVSWRIFAAALFRRAERGVAIRRLGLPVLTTDAAWQKAEVGVEIRVVR